MRYQYHVLRVALALALAGAANSTRADELADKGRDIFKKHQHAVVTVQVVLKISYSGAAKTAENRQELTGTVVDPSGLTVLALSACDPSEMYQRMLTQQGSQNKLEIEVTDMQILQADGTELAAEIVLRDKDQDLAFIRPKTKPASPMAAVDLAKASPAQVLDQVVTLNRLNSAAGRAHAASVERISDVIQKPRTFYIPDSTMTSTTLGSPAFALDGNIVGVVVMRAVMSGAGASRNVRENLSAIILPAEDILKAAKQAPEVKSEPAKKEEAKDAKPAN